MATLAAYNGVAFTVSGTTPSVAANATVEVRREDTGALASIYSDENGTTGITNPSAFADSNGRFTFYAVGIDRGYKITVTKDAFSYSLRNQSVGKLGQVDFPQGLVSVKEPRFGATGDGVTDDGAAITAALSTLSAGGTLYFPKGTYAYATSPNFAVSNLEILCAQGTVFSHTGTGNAFSVDGGSSGSGKLNMRIENAKVTGNVNSTNGFYLRSIHHSCFINLHVTGCATTGSAFRTEWCIQNTFINPTVTLNQDGGLSPEPLYGMHLTSRNISPYEPTTTTTLINPIFQGLNGGGSPSIGAGLYIDYAHETVTVGGVFSSCTIGVQVTASDPNAGHNFFLPHFENNETDISFASHLNAVHGAVCNGNVTIGGNNNLFDHCTIAGRITFNGGSTKNVIRDSYYALLSDNGTQNLFPRTYDTTANSIVDEQSGTWTPSVGGTATYTTQHGRWKKIGRMVYVEAQLVINVIGTGSTTVISGLPFVVSGNVVGASMPCYYFASLVTGVNTVACVGSAVLNTSGVHFTATTTAGGTLDLPEVIFQNSSEVRFSGWYEAAS